jgi:hypothetical protein
MTPTTARTLGNNRVDGERATVAGEGENSRGTVLLTESSVVGARERQEHSGECGAPATDRVDSDVDAGRAREALERVLHPLNRHRGSLGRAVGRDGHLIAAEIEDRHWPSRDGVDRRADEAREQLTRADSHGAIIDPSAQAR